MTVSFRATGFRRLDRGQAMSFLFSVLFVFDDFFFRAGHGHAGHLHRSARCALEGAPQGILSILFLGFFAFCGVLLPLGGGVPLAAFCPPFFLWFWVVGLGISAISCTLASLSVGLG